MNLDGAPASGPVLQTMTNALRHRGPEASAVYLDSNVAALGLGHTRLRIIDLSEAADQPMASDDGRLQVTFNGEIYNYRELRRILEAGGARFRTSSDTEVLLRLYEAKGEGAIDAIDGMFAFALWDGWRNVLLLGRDRAGKKPLFYVRKPRLFAFASEIKALLRHPDLAPEIDTSALPAFFLYGYAPCPTPLHRGVRQLPPGHILSVTPSGDLRAIEYWDVPLRPASAGAPASIVPHPGVGPQSARRGTGQGLSDWNHRREDR